MAHEIITAVHYLKIMGIPVIEITGIPRAIHIVNPVISGTEQTSRNMKDCPVESFTDTFHLRGDIEQTYPALVIDMRVNGKRQVIFTAIEFIYQVKRH